MINILRIRIPTNLAEAVRFSKEVQLFNIENEEFVINIEDVFYGKLKFNTVIDYIDYYKQIRDFIWDHLKAREDISPDLRRNALGYINIMCEHIRIRNLNTFDK